MREELRALAKRVMALTGADREVDARIWCALRGVRYKAHFEAYGSHLTQVEYREPPRRTRLFSDGGAMPHAESFTADLNAAMTLVPEGWKRLTFERHDDGAGCFLGPIDTFAATPALALTAAALLARAEQVQP